MTKCVAFGFQRGRIRVAAMMDTPAIALTSSFKIDIDDTLPLPSLMDRYKKDLENTLRNEHADVVSVKFVFETTTINAAKGSSLPSGILALICHEMQLP